MSGGTLRYLGFVLGVVAGILLILFNRQFARILERSERRSESFLGTNQKLVGARCLRTFVVLFGGGFVMIGSAAILKGIITT